jgi:mRNA interferase RelE/StbE
VKIQFRASFAKDLRNIKNKDLLKRINEIIEQVETAQTSQDITNLKKLKGDSSTYRIRAGEYRIGLIVESDTVTFVRCLNRKEIYRKLSQK